MRKIQKIRQNEADSFASAMIGSRQLLLRSDGDICALARIAHRSDTLVRINKAVTDRQKRENGYAGMLVAEMSRRLISEGVTPMLYADASNPSPNSEYTKIGFVKTGEITEYILK